MENQTPETPEKKESDVTSSSLLNTILEEAQKPTGETTPVAGAPVAGVANLDTSATSTIIAKKKEPVSYVLILKFLASIFFVALIFFGSFLAYVVFNPSQAQFFENFLINPNDIAILLGKLVNAIFGFIVVIVSIAWIFFLFRAIWTAKELKRKRLLRWLLAGVTGIILFSLITLWAFLIETINATDYTNPAGTILLYDHELWVDEEVKGDSQIYDTSQIIGPIRIYFDIAANARLMQDKNPFTRFESFRIDFDGAICPEGNSEVTGSNLTGDETIICTFDRVKRYAPRGVYLGRDRDGNPEEIEMEFPTIEVRGLVNIKKQQNKDNKNIITYDASALRSLGSPTWVYENNREVNQSSITEVEGTTPRYICLKLIGSGCNRVFVIPAERDQDSIGKIVSTPDSGNSLRYSLGLEELSLNENEIISIEWIMDKRSVLCNNNEKVCDYTFTTYGKKDISVNITLASNETYTLETTLLLEEPVKLVRKVKVLGEENEELNTESTYDSSLKAYVLKDIIFPSQITFDARDVVPAQAGYKLEKVDWDIQTTNSRERKLGETMVLDIIDSYRYTVRATYTFSYAQGQTMKTATSSDTVIVDTETKDLIPIISINQSSDYLPATVSVDGSASRSKKGEIKKFIFTFGEGRPPVEGDPQQTYEYLTAGEKEITLTIVGSDGKSETTKKIIVIKDVQRVVDFVPSIAPGVAGVEVDFSPKGVVGQIEDYAWNFGDGTPIVRGVNPSHTFQKSGKYNITLTIRYSDGTQKSETKEYKVDEFLTN